MSPGVLGQTGKHSKTMGTRLWGRRCECRPVCANGRQRPTLGVGLCLPPCLRQGLSCCSPQHSPGWLVPECPGVLLSPSPSCLGTGHRDYWWCCHTQLSVGSGFKHRYSLVERAPFPTEPASSQPSVLSPKGHSTMLQAPSTIISGKRATLIDPLQTTLCPITRKSEK